MLIKIFILLIFCSHVLSSNETVNEDALPSSILELRTYYQVVNALEKRAVLSKQQADNERQIYFQRAQRFCDKEKLTIEEFLRWDQHKSIISFSNILAVIAGIIVFTALLILASLFLIPILNEIPKKMWQVILYGISFTLMFYVSNHWLIFLGCLLFLGVHSIFSNNNPRSDEDGIFSVLNVVTVVWGLVTLFKQNTEASYLTTIGIEYILILNFCKSNLITQLGFSSEEHIGIRSIASLILTLSGCFLHLKPNYLTSLNIFIRPFILIGAFVYSSLIITQSSVWYCLGFNERYSVLQIVTLTSCLTGIFFGSLLSIPFLQSVCGMMLVCWLIEKFLEIATWEHTGVIAFNLLLLGLTLYYVAFYLKRNPQYFILAEIIDSNVKD